MFGVTLNDLLVRLVAMLVVTALFGAFLALAAQLLGDRGPRDDGRLTLNPFEHLDILAAIPFVLFQTGWIRPMAIDSKRLRPAPVPGTLLAVVAALAATVATIALVWGLRRFGLALVTEATAVAIIENVVRTMLEMAAWFALLNLVPVPPLAGGHLLAALAPRAHAALTRYSLIVRVALIAILWTGWPQALARPTLATIMGLVGARA